MSENETSHIDDVVRELAGRARDLRARRRVCVTTVTAAVAALIDAEIAVLAATDPARSRVAENFDIGASTVRFSSTRGSRHLREGGVAPGQVAMDTLGPPPPGVGPDQAARLIHDRCAAVLRRADGGIGDAATSAAGDLVALIAEVLGVGIEVSARPDGSRDVRQVE